MNVRIQSSPGGGFIAEATHDRIAVFGDPYPSRRLAATSAIDAWEIRWAARERRREEDTRRLG